MMYKDLRSGEPVDIEKITAPATVGGVDVPETLPYAVRDGFGNLYFISGERLKAQFTEVKAKKVKEDEQ